MNREDIIRMVRDSHLNVYGLGTDYEKFLAVIERFATLVASAEREVCIDLVAFYGGPVDLEAAIRARGQA